MIIRRRGGHRERLPIWWCWVTRLCGDVTKVNVARSRTRTTNTEDSSLRLGEKSVPQLLFRFGQAIPFFVGHRRTKWTTLTTSLLNFDRGEGRRDVVIIRVDVKTQHGVRTFNGLMNVAKMDTTSGLVAGQTLLRIMG